MRAELTSLESLTIDECNELKALPAGIGQLGALKQLTLAVCLSCRRCRMPRQADIAGDLDD